MRLAHIQMYFAIIMINMNTTNSLKWLYYWIWYSYIARMLTHLDGDKMAAISLPTLSNKISWMEMSEFRLKYHRSLFLSIQLIIYRHWLSEPKDGYPDSKVYGANMAPTWVLWAPDGPLVSCYQDRLPTCICVTRPQWVKARLERKFSNIHDKQF